MSDQKTFLSEVMEHIKMKEARKLVTAELSSHIEEGKKEWIGKGLDEKEAEEKAVEQMGNPYAIGEKFNKIYRPQVDWVTIGLLAAVLGLGFLPLIPLYAETGDMRFINNRLLIIALGACSAAALMLWDYRKSSKWGWFFYITGIALLWIMSRYSLPGLVTTVNGIPSLSIGPLTLSGYSVLIFFFIGWAAILQKSNLRLWMFVILFFFPFYLLYKIHVSLCFFYTIMIYAMLFQSPVKRKLMLALTTCSLLAAAGIIYGVKMKSYLFDRINGFLFPGDYSQTSGYIYVQIKDVLERAGWFGLPNILETNNGVPNAHTDFAFLSVTRSYGYLMALFLAAVLLAFFYRIMFITSTIRDPFGKTLITGVGALYITQVLYSIMMSMGLLPIMSVTLPFISYGLMPTLLNSVLIGMVLSIYRRKNITAHI
ncbi:FtsW/RodA/SpoVE family cell cycle protein [Metabacillus sp. FJAT-52054]|uniref:FtsW/RodA/SpoVE family cell cycle protein n=1 Tax=Metabacillus sediminis TaxID=3117746 RepID=A0ABZ2NIZ1_9BACI